MNTEIRNPYVMTSQTYLNAQLAGAERRIGSGLPVSPLHSIFEYGRLDMGAAKVKTLNPKP